MSTAYGPDSQDDDTEASAGGQGPRPDNPYDTQAPGPGVPAPYPPPGWQGATAPPPPGWQGAPAPPPPGWYAATPAPGWHPAPPPPPPPPPQWYGYGGQPWPGGPGYSGPGAPDRRQRRGRRRVAIAAGIAAAALAAGGTVWATAGTTTLSTAQIASQTDPGLVDVISTLGYQHGTAEGTGMVLTATGEVLTNNHVVAGATSIQVRDVGNDQTYSARVVGYSDGDDVAVLQLSDASGLSTVRLGNSSSVRVGQDVVAIGNAEGKEGTPSVVTGTVTQLRAAITASDEGSGNSEQLTDMIQSDAGIVPGDSGGPLLNASGQVIGMDTAASTSNSPVGTTAAETTEAFSIPINKALAIADQIEAGASSTTIHIGATAFLGVEVSSTTAGSGYGQPGSGVTIEGIVAGAAAANAGLTAGDTITSIDGHDVTSSSDLQATIQLYHPGDKVTVGWQDQYGQAHTTTVTLTQGPTG
jgi:S1-C subfamily serine protease